MLVAVANLFVGSSVVRCQTPLKNADRPVAIDSSSFLDIADQDMVFDDQSALTNQANLHSDKYSQFIHQLYHFDTDNLQKFDHLYTQHQQQK